MRVYGPGMQCPDNRKASVARVSYNATQARGLQCTCYRRFPENHVPDIIDIFAPQAGMLEMMIRGTAIYWILFVLLRLAGRRDVGSLGTADLLVLVLVADAAGDAMSGASTSVIDGAVVVTTIVAWSVVIDRLSYYVPALDRILEPERVCIVRNGRIIRSSMRSEQITRRELMEQLRLKGVGSLHDIKRAYLESTGEFSVITMDEDTSKGGSTLD